MTEFNILGWTILLMFLLLLLFIYLFLWNDTLNKKLNLPAGGGKCLYESFIHSNSWFIQEWSNSLYERVFESLIHTIRSKRGIIQKL